MLWQAELEPLFLGWDQYKSIPRIEPGRLRIPNCPPEIQDVIFTMDRALMAEWRAEEPGVET